MMLLGTTQMYVFVPVTGPAGVDLTQYTPPKIALMPDNGTEPGAGDWKTATWMAPSAGLAPEPALLYHPGDYPPGEYMAFVQIPAGAEVPALPSGRVRIGDVRT